MHAQTTPCAAGRRHSQSCSNCSSNALALGGDCGLACPSGDLGALAALPLALRSMPEYVFLAFLAADISQQVGGGTAWED